ncbi:prostaglandin F2-alpha receptor-like [Leucoraja erinacea]|uniref:prostaglandin F2-alpha receptor-like n=1 Tax=Leucoraja erinaceus TaxID=7782 RepID=UPI002457FEF4|nr:prostaglandin F2-alpha receptor-like [Leucoraja erinacea]
MSEANISSAGSTPNTTSDPCTKYVVSVKVPIIFMTIGIVSNSIAFVILVKAYKRFRQKWRASFLLFASSLVFTDCLGHIITGAITVSIYAQGKDWGELDPYGYLCSTLGTCMVFFGLVALFLGSVMAIERCLGITQPFFHSVNVRARCAKIILGSIWTFALCVALLPILHFGEYTVQCAQTWCFIKTQNVTLAKERAILLLFSFLGLGALGISLICNTISGVTLVRTRAKTKPHRRGKSQHVEMLVQLVTVMCVSCICWGPFLVTTVMIGCSHEGPQTRSSLLLGVRMAAWNQILDPWVYILLRRSMLRRGYDVVQLCRGKQDVGHSRWDCSTLERSIKSAAMERTLASMRKQSQKT